MMMMMEARQATCIMPFSTIRDCKKNTQREKEHGPRPNTCAHMCM